MVDYVEVYNGRVIDSAVNARASDFARAHGLPFQVSVSDAHMEREVGTVATAVDGAIDTGDKLLRALRAGTSLIVREPIDSDNKGAFRRLVTRARRGRGTDAETS